jgi:hypothetical protein
MLWGMAVYRLRNPIRVQKVTGLLSTISCRFEFTDIPAGDTVEAISSANHDGRVLIRHAGQCYRAWKEELRNAHIAHRVVLDCLPNGALTRGR